MRNCMLSIALCAAVAGCGGPADDELAVQEVGSSLGEIRFGEETSAHPAVGLLEMQIAGLSYLCSGALIAPDTVLTAAHCVYGASPAGTFFQAGAGATFGSGPTYGVDSIAVTPGYSAIGDVNVPDLAVLRLQGAVPGISPLPLAPSAPTVGMTLRGVGFGQDETNGASGIKRSGLMVLDTRVVGSAALPSGGSYAPGLLTVRPGPSDQLACPGDSGGPLLDAGGAIAGVASYLSLPAGTPASQYCTAGLVATYVSVADSSALIASLTGSLPPPPAVPGSCKVEDGAFFTAEGGCRDNQSGLVYSRRLPKLRQAAAVKRCRNLVEGGYSDWRLPTANELRGMATRGGRSHLAGGSAARLWSKTRQGQDGITVKMSSGAKQRSVREKKRPVYCVRG